MIDLSTTIQTHRPQSRTFWGSSTVPEQFTVDVDFVFEIESWDKIRLYYANALEQPYIESVSGWDTVWTQHEGQKPLREFRVDKPFSASSDVVFVSSISSDDFIFRGLIEQWHKERGATSSITTMAMCPAYQRIIAMGPDCIPLILRQLEKEGDEADMWFWALGVLARTNPVANQDRGDIVKMARSWLRWGRQRYVW